MKISEIFWKKDQYKPSNRGFKSMDEVIGPSQFAVKVGSQQFIYSQEEVPEEDTVKIWHNVTDSKGNTHSMDWSPYETPTAEEVELWIRLGMPKRISTGPLTHNDLIKVARQKGIQLNRRK